VLAQLQVDHVAFFQVDDLVGDAGQGHGVAGQEAFVGVGALAHAQHQRAAFARAHHAVRLVTAEHGDGVGALQAGGGALHGVEQVTVVELVHQVGDHLGVGLAFEDVALVLQLGAQFVMVFNDAVVHQADALARKMRVGVVHRRHAVRGPAGVGDAGARQDAVLRDLGFELGHPAGAAGAAQFTALVHRHAAAVVAAVFQPLQALDEDRDDVAGADGADDATHGVGS
jgi:hypothetical protein